MTQKVLKDVGASVRQRLLNLAHERSEDFNLVLTRFATERLLYRLTSSSYRDQFVLKGAMLFSIWQDEPHRPTRDLDLLGFGAPDVDRLREVFREVCAVEAPDDGLEFDPKSITAQEIRENDVYSGIRLRLVAALAEARIPVQVDVGFGDSVSPPPKTVELPPTLDLPPVRVRAYPPEVAVAEKFEAVLKLGIANSRMKDFFDLHFFASGFSFDGGRLGQAVQSTFKTRKTPLPMALPLALTAEFFDDSSKKKQWEAFLKKGRLQERTASLKETCEAIAALLMPVIDSLREGRAMKRSWPAGGPWRDRGRAAGRKSHAG